MKSAFKLLLVLLLITSCSDIVNVEDISGRVVTVLAPIDGAMLTATEVSFSWNTVEDSESYRLQIAFPDFENATAIVEDSTVTTTNFSKALNSGSYEWRVRAENSDYQTAYTTQSLNIAESDAIDISNEEVVLLAPANAVIFTTTDTINFSWETVLNAQNYTMQIATPDFTNATTIIENEVVTTTNFSVSNLEIGNYEWRIKAENSDFETAYTTQSFIIE